MAKQESYDAIVIGGGHNGLVNAAYLARAGMKTLVLEQRHVLGGATVSEEIYPGFKFSVFSYVVSLMRPEIIRELELVRHGLTILPLESTITPLPDGRYIYRGPDSAATFRNISQFSTRDAEAYREYSYAMYHMAKAVKYILSIRPPDPTSFDPRELLALLKLGKHFLSLGEENIYTLAKLMTMSSADFLEEWFETDPLIATLSASGIIGTFLGPRSPGSAYVLLHHYMGEIDGVFRAWGFARGGTGGVAEAIASSARALGAELRTEARVAHVITRNGRAVGVALENGDEIYAKRIISSLDPKLTFLKLVDRSELPDDLVARVSKFDSYGSSGKVNLALDGMPDLSCLPGYGEHMRGAISISPSVNYIERAYDEAKYGRFAKKPYVDIIFPSAIDPGMAPPGKHVMSCFVQYAPYTLAEGDWNSQREAFGDAVVDTLSEYMPNLKNLILHRQVLSPWDIEQTIGLSGGNIFQGELSLSQLFFLRPAPGYAQYRTPIANYYQCGSGTHPGGGITGAPGRLAAIEILKDAGKVLQ
ncbi:MAG: NAD(P)/FAD-dependent oxidoreductase [Anaerolineales bacterium]|nr:MAG: NAD(P)/FAD-dependent oxidoreductase [Anaerolineales bacterium]